MVFLLFSSRTFFLPLLEKEEKSMGPCGGRRAVPHTVSVVELSRFLKRTSLG
jgi:hypothetical protein